MQKQLKKANLTPNLTILLYGPPGTGKTTLVRAFSKKYDIPICVVESHRLISSLLGDTIKAINNAINTAAKISKKKGAFVLFFDEIDALGSERSSIHEVGEIKRAVISFLQAIDRINYKGYPLAIIGATNHEKQLDSAIWRRFTFHLSFKFPDFHVRKKIFEVFLSRVDKANIGIDKNILQNLDNEYNKIKSIETDLGRSLGRSVSEFEDTLFWEKIENMKTDGLLKITHGYSGSDIERGTRVALFKAIHTETLTYDVFYSSIKLVGGTAIHVDSYGELGSLKKINKGPTNIDAINKGGSGPPEI